MSASITTAVVGPIADLLSQLILISAEHKDIALSNEMASKVPVRCVPTTPPAAARGVV